MITGNRDFSCRLSYGFQRRKERGIAILPMLTFLTPTIIPTMIVYSTYMLFEATDDELNFLGNNNQTHYSIETIHLMALDKAILFWP